MKLMPLFTIAVLTLLSSNNSYPQDAPAPPPRPEDEVRRAEDEAAKQADQARKELGQARQELDLARQEFERAGQHLKIAPKPPEGVFSQRLNNIIKRVTGDTMGASRPLVIRTSPMDPKDLANLEEDLEIMARILAKAIDEIPSPGVGYRAMGIDVFAPGSAPMRNFYLEGYGAVFALNVGFPLLPPAAPQADQKKDESETDSAWERAKRELHGQVPADVPHAPAEPFSEDKVNQLKTRLLEALKSASNIRDLKSDDSVTVCVFGGHGGGAVRVGTRTSAHASAGAAGGPPRATTWITTDQTAGPNGTIMTMRASKSDIEAFAKGKLDADQFRKHVRIQVYPGGPTGEMMFGGIGGGGFGGGSSGQF